MKKILKWTAIVVGSLVGLAAVAFVVLLIIGNGRANKVYAIAVTAPPIPTDAESIARGAHLVVINMCTDCHTKNLAGQTEFTIDGLLTIPTPNLTRGTGGVGSLFKDDDWVRAIQHGVGHDGRALIVMPSKGFSQLSSEEVGEIIAYIKSVPPVDNELPKRQIEPIGRVMMALGMFPPAAVDEIDHSLTPPATAPSGVTAAKGEYLTRICTQCHGDHLNGAPFGPPGQEVPTPNLTLGGPLASWTEADFVKTLRSGVTPGGKTLSDDMPWKSFGQMSDDELHAVWLYIQSLPPLAQGG
jgi:mono/diheme cytochrome c family protein